MTNEVYIVIIDDFSLQLYTLTLFKAGGGGHKVPTPVLFQPKHPEGLQKVGVMGYVNLSYYIGKTPKRILGPRKFFGPVQRPSKLGRRKILEPRNLDFFTLG